MIKYTVQYGVSAVLLSMLTNRFLHKRVLPCVCISGPPHRLLCKERKGFIRLIYTFYGLYAQAAVLQALRLMLFFSLSNDIKKDGLTLSYNPKDLKFIHHITDVRNLHEVKRCRGGACLDCEERKARGRNRNRCLNGSLQQKSAPGWSQCFSHNPHTLTHIPAN